MAKAQINNRERVDGSGTDDSSWANDPVPWAASYKDLKTAKSS